MRAAIALTVTAVLAAATAFAADGPSLVVRHEHYFLIVNDDLTTPTISVESRGYYTYGQALEIMASDDQATTRLRAFIPLRDSRTAEIPGEPAPIYLVTARPGYNGVIFDCDHPWGVAATGRWGLGSNGRVPQMYIYIPLECEEMTISALATSPKEAGRITVLQPDGNEALVMDGEFDKAEEQAVAIPAAMRGQVWSITWAKPQSVPGSLDDINVTVSGYLAPLLWTNPEWAQTHGPTVWERHKAVLDAQQ